MLSSKCKAFLQVCDSNIIMHAQRQNDDNLPMQVLTSGDSVQVDATVLARGVKVRTAVQPHIARAVHERCYTGF